MTHRLLPSSPRQTTCLPPWETGRLHRYRRTRALVRVVALALLVAGVIALAAWGLGAAGGGM